MNAFMNDSRPQWKTRQPVESQLTEIRMAFDQLWTKATNAETLLEKAAELLNTDITQTRLLSLIKAINGHSSGMPDFKGENADHDMRYATLMKLRQYLKNPTSTDSLQIGTSANHILIDQNGNISLVGSATVFDDADGPLIGEHLESPSSDIETNSAEGTIDYKNSATLIDYVIINIQRRHTWKLGSDLFPHLHWFQASATMPNWMIQYRYQINGEAKETAWSPLIYTANVFTYSSGTILQKTKFGSITPPAGYGLSDIIQYRIIRDTNNDSGLFGDVDGLAATVSALSFDDHYEKDSIGSNTEYTK